MAPLLKEIFFRVVPRSALPKDRAVILMYHSVSEKTNYFMNVEPRVFEKQMEYLERSHRPVISLQKLADRLENGDSLGGAVAITFDDGYRDNFTVAYPILKKHNFPATIFVETNLIGHTDKRGLPRLSESDLRELESSRLVDIQPHTKSHPHLSSLDESATRDEILGSKLALDSLLQKNSRLFAYPYGDYSSGLKSTVLSAGFEAACSVHEGTVTGNSDIFALPRVSIDSSTSFAQFKAKLTRAIDLYESIKHMI